MLTHGDKSGRQIPRVVILGARGFVGSAADLKLRDRGLSILSIGRADIDFSSRDAARQLIAILRPDDAVIVISARAPVKDYTMLADNFSIMSSICAALSAVQPSHVVYISSDAVYADSKSPLTEQSCAEPTALHGAMHLTRELMLQSVVAAPLAILRPTLIYGASDPHNGYGPNRFRRLTAAGNDIVLFGDGEERRDHVLIDDVAEIIWHVIRHRSSGKLNVATGEVHSFRSIAERIANMRQPAVAVRSSPRSGPMPHGGYRAFDISNCRAAFPHFSYTGLDEGFKKVGLA
jgi:UDP-glucose 4-epimerase